MFPTAPGVRHVRTRADTPDVLTILAVLCGVGAVTIAVRWWTRRVDALGRARPCPWLSVVALLVVGAIALVPGFRRAHLEHRLDAVASDLAGTPVTIHCQTAGESFVDAGGELGYVKWTAGGTPEHHALLKREQCGALRHYLGSDMREPSYDDVVAVHVLTHEAMHMAGLKGEADAECAAVQRDAKAAELLGASPADALAVAQRYYRDVYPNLPGDYRSTDCVAGGRLDERLPTAPW